MRRLAIALISAALAVAGGLGLAGGTAGATAASSAPRSVGASPLNRAVPSSTPPTTVAAGAATVATAGGATADDGTGDAADLAPVDVLQVSGLFDAVVVDSIEQAVDRSEHNGSQALVLQMSSDGATVSRATMSKLVDKLANSTVAIAIWVGPSSGSRVYGLPAQLFAVADVSAMVQGSRIGHSGEPLAYNGRLVDFGAAAATLRTGSMNFNEARAAGVLRLQTTDLGVPTVRSMIQAMDGAPARGRTLDTVALELKDDGSTQSTSTLVRFNGLGLGDQLMHTVASPSMAYLFFVIGAALLIFEFFTAGVGVAGLVGAVLLIFGCYGFAELPVRPFALVLLVLAMLAFAIDVQVGVPRFWTGVGITMFIVASWFLYEPLPGTDLRLSWITLVAGVAGVMLTYIVGMPSMVRTRFATPTIGREWMIGETGTATEEIDPEGIAMVGAARWHARTNRATPIGSGAELRVVGIDGVTLQVEPLDGAARDYRERRGRD
ncbi:MAG: NfeD family protein [Ilumatobacteraceae bacterium]